MVCSDPNIFSWQLYNVNIRTFIHQYDLDLRACLVLGFWVYIHDCFVLKACSVCCRNSAARSFPNASKLFPLGLE